MFTSFILGVLIMNRLQQQQGSDCSGNSLSNVYYSSVLFANEQFNRGSCKYSAQPKGTLTN